MQIKNIKFLIQEMWKRPFCVSSPALAAAAIAAAVCLAVATAEESAESSPSLPLASLLLLLPLLPLSLSLSSCSDSSEICAPPLNCVNEASINNDFVLRFS